MSRYLNDQFDRTSLNKRSRIRVAPLTLIDIEHFEDLLPDMKAFGFGTLLEDYYRSHMRSAGGGHDQLVAFRRKNIPFLDDKPERADEKEVAFRRFFAELGARLFGEAAGADVRIRVLFVVAHVTPSGWGRHTRRTHFVRHLVVSRAMLTCAQLTIDPG